MDKKLDPLPLSDFEDNLLGYWVAGEVDKQQFAIACNKIYDLSANGRCTKVADVEYKMAVKTTYENSYWLDFTKSSLPVEEGELIKVTFVEDSALDGY